MRSVRLRVGGLVCVVRRRVVAVVAAAVGLSLAASLLGVPVLAAPASAAVDGVERDRSVPVSDLAAGPDTRPVMPPYVPDRVVLPSPGSSVVDLPSVAGVRVAGSSVVGGLPVRVSPVDPDGMVPGGAVSGSAPSRVRVDVLDGGVSWRAGAPVAVRVARADGVAGPARVRVEVDYSAFRSVFGADWSWRLGLTQLPECALASPQRFAGEPAVACSGFTRLSAVNDAKVGRISAEVLLPADGGGVTVGLLAAGGSTDTGDFTKTDLKESSSWAAGLQSGDFTWSYPLTVPPVPGGLVPDVALSYSSVRWMGRPRAGICSRRRSVRAGRTPRTSSNARTGRVMTTPPTAHIGRR